MVLALIENSSSIELLVEMSIGTDKGTWWADPDFGSELWILRRYGKVDEATAGKVQRAIEASVSWIVSDGLADSIDVVAERAGKTAIAWTVTVYKPDGTTELVKDVWNGIAAA